MKELIVSDDNRTWFGCGCLRTWWPWVNRLARERGLVKLTLDVTQGCYSQSSVAASGSTHNGGGVIDIAQHSDSVDELLEEMGAASFVRTPAQGFSYHTHLILMGCRHADPSALLQIADWKKKRDGLYYHRPDPDQTRPSAYRKWNDGVEWAQKQLRETAAAIEAAKKKKEEEDMARIDSISDEALKALGAATASALLNSAYGRDATRQTVGEAIISLDNYLRDISGKADAVAYLKGIDDKLTQLLTEIKDTRNQT